MKNRISSASVISRNARNLANSSSENTRVATSVTAPAASIAYVGRDISTETVVTGTSATLPVTTASKAGNALILSVMLTTGSGTVAATDTQGNTWTVATDATDTSSHRVLILYTTNAKSLSTSDMVTAAYPSSTKYDITMDEFTGVTTLDQHTNATGPAGGTTFTTPSITTTTGNELLFTALGVNSGTTAAFNTGWNQLSSAQRGKLARTVFEL